MPVLAYVLIALVVLILCIFVSCVKIVPQAQAYVMERLGAYQGTWSVGFHIKTPFLDRVARRVNLKEQVADFPPQPVITKDNVTMRIDTVVFYQITDPKLFTYGVDAVAAYERYGGPVLVIDFNTATTYDYVTVQGHFAAGITAPGIRISSEALWKETAKLPNIEIKKPKSILAQETISSMQAGLVYGQIGQTEYIINKVKEETGIPDMKVVATGGLGRLIAEETDAIDCYDPFLTLDGLRIIYQKNRGKA